MCVGTSMRGGGGGVIRRVTQVLKKGGLICGGPITIIELNKD